MKIQLITLSLLAGLFLSAQTAPKKESKQYRDSKSGQYTTKQHAESNKSTTQSISHKKK